MCIRDRGFTFAVFLFKNFALTVNFSPEVIWKGIYTGYPYTCLLYTSDAADERSSVDLGGRRIIKKKKRQNMAGRVLAYWDKNEKKNAREHY